MWSLRFRVCCNCCANFMDCSSVPYATRPSLILRRDKCMNPQGQRTSTYNIASVQTCTVDYGIDGSWPRHLNLPSPSLESEAFPPERLRRSPNFFHRRNHRWQSSSSSSPLGTAARTSAFCSWLKFLFSESLGSNGKNCVLSGVLIKLSA